MIKTYSELCRLTTFKERLAYLQTDAVVGEDTFGHDRYLNQVLYHSSEWKRIRNLVIVRDDGCDLAVPDYPIHGGIYIHHLNRVTKDMILNRDKNLFDLENLICVSFRTHNAIHYGGEPYEQVIERSKNDTIPWRT